MFSDFKVWVQGNKENEWFEAKDWQKQMFIKAQNYSQGNGHYTYGHTIGPELHDNYTYNVIVSEGYGSYILQNLHTKTERQLCGVKLPYHKGIHY